ncbi:MAG: 50S ribosomal protein L4 [Actinobacteria bacterium]|nr:50S ribosomal protein L4 [Actinomycetota bacterium]
MPKANVIEKTGTVNKIELNEPIFQVKASEGLVHESVRRVLALLRQGTHDTKTRSEVRGGGRKPWRQKGTGRARAGSIRSPLWKGGGVVFGPHPRDYGFEIPKKQKRKALFATLTYKAEADQIYIIEDFHPEAPRTKSAFEILKNAGIENSRITLVVHRDEETAALSFRNLPNVLVVEAESLNPYLVLNNEALVFTRAGFERMKEVWLKDA